MFLYLHKIQNELEENVITGIHEGRHEYVWSLICTLLNLPYVHRSTFNLRHSSDVIEIRKIFHLRGRRLQNILHLIEQHFPRPVPDVMYDVKVYASRFV